LLAAAANAVLTPAAIATAMRTWIFSSSDIFLGDRPLVRKLIAFDDDTFDKLRQLARDRMASFQELADEAFADLLRKHGIPVDLKDALRKSATLAKQPAKSGARETSRKSR
jgi:hypothetical protein